VLPQAFLVPVPVADAFPWALPDEEPTLAAKAASSADAELRAHWTKEVAHQAASADREPRVQRQGVRPLVAPQQAHPVVS
jgi:hypothetical protein